MIKDWKIKPIVPDEIRQRFPEINDITLQLLYNRGLDNQEKIDEFFYPDYSQDVHDPFLLPGIKKFIERIKMAQENGEKVAVHGDYDADGVTATALLVKTLRLYGIESEVYIPHRDKEGYGLNKETIKYLRKRGMNLIITLDCGITNIEEVKFANELGMDVIVTDHHEIEDKLPDAYAIIHARLPESKYPFGSLAGVGISFKIAQALLKSDLKAKREIDKDSFEKWLLDLVAIGTIADVAPLLGENRTLVKYGLVVLNKTRNIGLKKLIDLCRFKDGNLDSTSVAFRIAPRINAAGRMDHANTAYELLTTQSEEEAENLAKKLEANNQQRQADTEKIMMEAIKEIGKNPKDKLLLPYNDNWPKSLVGLVAGRLAEKYNRPVILMGGLNNEVYGSGRSLVGFNMIEKIQELDDFFSVSGGHAMAVGFTLKEKGLLRDFQKKMKRIAEQEINLTELSFGDEIDIDIELKEIGWPLFEDLEKFEPFGYQNPQPLFLCRELNIISLERVGTEGKHVRLMVKQKDGEARKMIGFCLSDVCANLSVGDKIDAVFEVSLNEWNGNRELQLKLVDLQKTV